MQLFALLSEVTPAPRVAAWLTAWLLLVVACRDRPDQAARQAPSSETPTVEPAPATSRSVDPGALAPESEVASPPAVPDDTPPTLGAQRERWLRRMQLELGVSEPALAQVRAVVEGSEWLGQGNPKIRKHAMTLAECRRARAGARTIGGDSVCGAPNMVAVFDPRSGGTARKATVCIDQYEFPNLPCEYPVVWVRASEARQICGALGKRLCDAHEWEGACAGRLIDPEADYGYGELPPVYASGHRRERRLLMEHRHNEAREVVWAYGPKKDHTKCATGARKDPRCTVVDWGICATNSYPTGAFPDCVSAFGVYDLHGNVAEHMSLPLYPEELGSAGGVGWTEMKGSWFLFAREETHPDDCRWRARNWHTTRTDHWNSHRNYHLGFRCCRDIESTEE